MITRLRSIIFDISFYIASAVIMIVFLPLLLLPVSAAFWAGRVWVRTSMFLLRHIVGLTYEIKGSENLPKTGGYIIASKHQSAWETLIFHCLVKGPAYALKKQLTWIPLINLYFWRMGMVTIDRGAATRALKSLITGGHRIMAENRPLIIYPEGTRSLPGIAGEYRAGVSILYRDLGVPVVPVALNSGQFWGRRSPVKYPGKITLEFLPPIQPGMNRHEFMQELENRIESACHRIQQETP